MYFLKIFLNIISPPALFIALLLILSIFLYRKDKKIQAFLNIIILTIYILSIPFTGEIIVRTLEKKYNPPEKINADVIVMLGGGAILDVPNINQKGQVSGSAANRLLSTASLYMKTKLPMILTGGQVFPASGNESQIARNQLILLNVPADKIIIEDKSRSTLENAKYIAPILKKGGFKKPLLVTSAFHMKRAMIIFKGQKIEPVPYPTDYKVNLRQTINTSKFIPSIDGLCLSVIGIKELQGLLYLKLSKY